MREEKHTVEYLNENVASMTGADRDEFSVHLGVRPVRACAGNISQARRDRYYWLSWPVPPSVGVNVVNAPDYYQVSFEAQLPDPKIWSDPGWTFGGDLSTKLPTFMRSLPKRTKPANRQA